MMVEATSSVRADAEAVLWREILSDGSEAFNVTLRQGCGEVTLAFACVGDGLALVEHLAEHTVDVVRVIDQTLGHETNYNPMNACPSMGGD
jgi:hypothetical protein